MIDSILPLLKKAKQASNQISGLSPEKRTLLVQKIASILKKKSDLIISQNQKDQAKMEDQDPKKDRLILDKPRINAMCEESLNVSKLPDPTNKVLVESRLENGIKLQKISVPLGVIGIIYESRPNVTLDAISLALKSGNALVLRGGSDAENSNQAIVQIAREVLESQNLDPNIITLLPTDRKFVSQLLTAEKYIDIIIPRGSANLIRFVRETSKIPTIETGAGVCHTFVEKTADLEMAKKIVENAKLQRPSVCNCLDTILVSREVASEFLPLILENFKKYSVEIWGDEGGFQILKNNAYPFLHKAKIEDFGREFLGYGASVRVVDSFDMALDHIAEYSSKHSESIVTENSELAEKFLRQVDAAAVYHNASTRFTDGGAFGLGAEMGVSTQKLHARGPFALEKLVTEKWILRGDGQIRD